MYPFRANPCLKFARLKGVASTGLQLTRILKEYVAYFNEARPHQGIAQRIPAPKVTSTGDHKSGPVTAFPVLNGLHHDYRRAAAQASNGQKLGGCKG